MQLPVTQVLGNQVLPTPYESKYIKTARKIENEVNVIFEIR